MRFSPTTGSFYPDDIDYGDKLPADTIDITQERFDAAMARPVGYTFDFVDGELQLYAPEPTPFAVIEAGFLTTVRDTRERILNRLAGIGFAAQADGDTATVSAILTARRALLDITKAPTVAAAREAEDEGALRLAVLTEYKRITANAPPSAQAAFNGVDA